MARPCCPICQLGANPRGSYWHGLYGDLGYALVTYDVQTLALHTSNGFHGYPVQLTIVARANGGGRARAERRFSRALLG
jgi:hypothetical protein